MGLIKLKKKDYELSMEFYKKLKNPKIDMTSFLNLLIKNKIINLGYFLTNRFWYEIDTPKDLIAIKKIKNEFQMVIWIIGLSRSGKTTLAKALIKKLNNKKRKIHTCRWRCNSDNL